jgi:hypothetical protein
MDNKNSGTVYVADANDNISKIAANISAAGGVTLTDRVSTAQSVDLFLSEGILYATFGVQASAIADWN